MKTQQLLKLSPNDMAATIKAMKAKECEKHAQNYAKQLSLDYHKTLMAATHAVLMSEQKASVAKRVSTSVWEYAQTIKGCSEYESDILAMILLMLLYNKSAGFKDFESLTKKLH